MNVFIVEFHALNFFLTGIPFLFLQSLASIPRLNEFENYILQILCNVLDLIAD